MPHKYTDAKTEILVKSFYQSLESIGQVGPLIAATCAFMVVAYLHNDREALTAIANQAKDIAEKVMEECDNPNCSLHD